MTITDFVTQREFERTALYNEVWRPYNLRFEWAIPLELGGNVVVVTVNRGSHFLPSELQKLRMLSQHMVQGTPESSNISETSRFGPGGSATCTASKSWSYHAGISYYALVDSRKAQQRDRFNFKFQHAYCAEACSKHFW